MNNTDSFYDVIETFTQLPGTIDSLNEESFKNVHRSDLAKTSRNIVYVWRAKKSFSRYRGESDILYIGQTKQTFSQRYNNHHKWINTAANSLKYRHALDEYGGMTISVCDYKLFGTDLRNAEGQLLWWYFQNHHEYPPFNYTQTKVRRNEY